MNNTSLPILKGRITQEDALDSDRDVIQQLSYPGKRFDFYIYLYQHRPQIAAIVSRHLGIPESEFTLGDVKEWIHGSFNVCLPIHIETDRKRTLPRRAIIRLPLPYKIGEAFRPGNVDEKLRCEAATYLWLQNNCPSVPIPRLFGFGFPGTQSVGGRASRSRPGLSSDRIPSSLRHSKTNRFGIAWYGICAVAYPGSPDVRLRHTLLTFATICWTLVTLL